MLSEIVRYVAVFCSGIAITLSIAGNTRYKDCKEYLEYRRRAEGCLREAQKQIENHQKNVKPFCLSSGVLRTEYTPMTCGG